MKKNLIFLLVFIVLAILPGCSNIFKNGGNNGVPNEKATDVSVNDSKAETDSDGDSSIANDKPSKLTGTSLDSEGQPIGNESHTLKLYFSDAQAEYVVQEERNVTVNKGSQLEKVIFEELKKGPQNDEAGSVIPKGTRLLSANTKDGTCRLDLSKEFFDNHAGGTAGEMMTLYSIVNSLTELPNVKRVQFLIEGKVSEVYIHASLDTPFERDENIIKK